VNYFNYFTEIEEHFQQARASGFFLLSPLDWAMIETWKDSGVPLEAVHKGIDRAFEKWRARKQKTRMVNSLAYCAQEVLGAASEDPAATADAARENPTPPFDTNELTGYFRRNARQIREAIAQARPPAAAIFQQTAESLDQLAEAAQAGQLTDLESVEQRLTVLEERLLASVMQSASEDEMLATRQEMDRQLAPYRRKMTADQLALLEKQYLQRKQMESAGLPRLSLFYL
jgi:hypothetical protein